MWRGLHCRHRGRSLPPRRRSDDAAGGHHGRVPTVAGCGERHRGHGHHRTAPRAHNLHHQRHSVQRQHHHRPCGPSPVGYCWHVVSHHPDGVVALMYGRQRRHRHVRSRHAHHPHRGRCVAARHTTLRTARLCQCVRCQPDHVRLPAGGCHSAIEGHQRCITHDPSPPPRSSSLYTWQVSLALSPTCRFVSTNPQILLACQTATTPLPNAAMSRPYALQVRGGGGGEGAGLGARTRACLARPIMFHAHHSFPTPPLPPPPHRRRSWTAPCRTW